MREFDANHLEIWADAKFGHVSRSPPLAIFRGSAYAGAGADVAELVDARDLKSLEGNLVPVRFRPSALKNIKELWQIRRNSFLIWTAAIESGKLREHLGHLQG